MPRSSAAADGFTLLEVLAAVAILGIWYVMLAAAAIQGLQRQGESHRRLEASFVADDVIAEIEAALSGGTAPETGVDEFERGDFKVRVEVEPFALDVPPPAAIPRDSGSRLALPNLVVVPNLLGGAGPTGEPSPLRSVRVQVSWTEGHDERSVIRATYAFDLASVQSQLQSLEGTITQDTNEPALRTADGVRSLRSLSEATAE